MIQAKDLRIGNYVREKRFGFIEQIKMIDSDCSVCSLRDGLCDLDLLEPIPLTEEWLIKFGFGKRHSFLKENDKKVFDYRINDYSVTLNRWVLDDKISFWVLDTCINDENIKYVHQLQNLYFALTGEEL